jgi:hypothetical protein
MLIDTPSQSVRSSFFQCAEPEPVRVSVVSLRNMSGERKYHASTFNPPRRIAEASTARRSRRCGRNHVCWLLLGGWSLGSTTYKIAKERSELAVIAALAPVCADRALPDAEAKQVALSKVDSWKRRDEFPKELVTLPGESYPSSALVDACSTLLLAPKSAALK